MKKPLPASAADLRPTHLRRVVAVTAVHLDFEQISAANAIRKTLLIEQENLIYAESEREREKSKSKLCVLRFTAFWSLRLRGRVIRSQYPILYINSSSLDGLGCCLGDYDSEI